MNAAPEIWVIDDDRSIRWVLEKALAQAKLASHSFETADKALARLKRERPAVIITDIRMPGTDGLALLEQVHAAYPQMPVIVMTAYADLDRAVAAFQGGAFEYLPKPFDVDEAVAIVHWRKLLMTRRPRKWLRNPLVFPPTSSVARPPCRRSFARLAAYRNRI